MNSYDWTKLAELATPVTEPARETAFAVQFPAEYQWIMTSNFGFAGKMRDVLAQWGGLTQGQFAAVRKCMAYAQRPAPAAVLAPVVTPPGELDISKIPDGRYAVPGGDTRLKVAIKHGTDKWQGWTFVKDAAEYGQGQRYGSQRPGQLYYGQIQTQLAIIAKDPAAASRAYGKLVGRCGVCGRMLEDEESVANGIGPICAGKMGF